MGISISWALGSVSLTKPPKVSGSQTTFFEPFLRGTFRSREQNVVSGAFEDKNGNCALFIINSQRSQETVSLSIKENEYGITGEIETDSLSNGMEIVSSERKDGFLKIGCILKPEGTGIIKWKRKI